MKYILSTRARNSLLKTRAGDSPEAVSRMTEEDLSIIPGCGRRTVGEIREWLRSMGMDVHDPYVCSAGGAKHKFGGLCSACGGFTTWGSDWGVTTTVYPIAGSRLPAYGTDREVREDGGWERVEKIKRRDRGPNQWAIERFTKYLNRHGYTVIPPKVVVDER